MIGINNKAKIEGIKTLDSNAKVRFIAVEDTKTTKMCQSLDGQIFNTNTTNEFFRYSDSNKKMMKYRVKGLVLGLNLPSINDHFHYCRSTIIYNLDPKVEKEVREGIYKTTLEDQEQYQRYKKYFGNAINSIEDFVKIKYNKYNAKYEELKNKYYVAKKQYEVKNNIANTNIKPVKQGQHILGSKYYHEEKDKSYFDIPEQEVYSLLNEKKGTGLMLKENDTYKEIVVVDKEIGYFINKTHNIKEKTNTFIIIYSKEGMHGYPIKTRRD